MPSRRQLDATIIKVFLSKEIVSSAKAAGLFEAKM